MKKILAFLLFALAASFGRADTKTRYVYVVSNIYNQVFTESVVTQKIKNTHTNYYITNNVTTVNKIYNTTFTTNLSVNCDLSDTYVRAASNQANRASGYVSNASGFADSAADSATAAASSASSASSSASSAAYQRTQAANECDTALATINARINWFDEHMGGRIDNYTWTTNIYYAEDSTARNTAAANANAITNLQGRATSLEGTAAANADAITNLQGRATSLEGTAAANADAITNLQGRATSLEGTAAANADAITNLLDCVYVSNGKGIYKFLMTGWNASSFFVYVNSTNYTDKSDGTSAATDYRQYWSTVANQIWFERVSGVGTQPVKIRAYHYGSGYVTQAWRGRLNIQVYSSSSSYRDYWTTTDDTSMVAGVLPTTFVYESMNFVSVDSRIPIKQWCLETFQLK